MKKICFLFVFCAALLSGPAIWAQASENASAPQTLPVEEVCAFLKQCEVYYLATVEGNQPRVRPFGTAAIFEGKLYIQTGKVKNVSKQIQANPKVEICAYNAASGQWLRVAATLVDDPRVAAKQFMLDAYPSLKGMYSAEDANTQVLYLKDATATFSSFSGEPKILTF